MRDSDNNENPTPNSVRLWFGIFMILVYVGVGLLFLLDIFMIGNPGVCIAVGVILCLYGVWRGYRLYKGIN